MSGTPRVLGAAWEMESHFGAEGAAMTAGAGRPLPGRWVSDVANGSPQKCRSPAGRGRRLPIGARTGLLLYFGG